jgi:bacterioferritin
MVFFMGNSRMNMGHEAAEWMYSAPASYPEPRVIRPNQYYAQIFQEILSGPASKQRAVAQYTHHSRALSRRYSSVSDTLQRISEVETRHIQLSLKAIRLLEGNALGQTASPGQREYPIYRGKDLCDRLAADLHMERLIINACKAVQAIVEDPFVLLLVERIIQDDEAHVATLSRLVRETCLHHAEAARENI